MEQTHRALVGRKEVGKRTGVCSSSRVLHWIAQEVLLGVVLHPDNVVKGGVELLLGGSCELEHLVLVLDRELHLDQVESSGSEHLASTLVILLGKFEQILDGLLKIHEPLKLSPDLSWNTRSREWKMTHLVKLLPL